MLKFTEHSADAAALLFPQPEHTLLHDAAAGYTVLTVQDGDAPIGYALLQQDAQHAWLRHIYITPENRRCCFGKTLMSVAASKAMQWAHWQLYAVAPDDAIACAFCNAVGFVPTADDPTLLALDLTETQGMRHGR